MTSREVDLGGVEGDAVEIAANLSHPVSRFEVRLYCRGPVEATISAVEVDISDYVSPEKSQTDELGFRTGARRAVTGGRDIEAGYIRGMGIELGGLKQMIADDPDWRAAIAASRGRSIMALDKLMNIFLIVKYSEIAEGNIIEFGSFRGGCALFLATLAKRLRPGCKVFALDTFEGTPVADESLDRHWVGAFSNADLPGFERAREEDNLDNLVIMPGLFEESLEQIAPKDRRFFLCHIDCDVYRSVVFAIESSKKYAVSGSYLVFDDPLTSDCIGAMQAVEECLVREGVHAEQAYPHLVYRYPPLTQAAPIPDLQDATE